MIDTGNPFYVDDGLLLTKGETLTWHKRCLEAFPRDPASNKVHFIESVARWAAKIKETSWVIVERREWESGLDSAAGVARPPDTETVHPLHSRSRPKRG